MKHGKKYGYREITPHAPITAYTEESVKEYYAVCAEIDEAHRKFTYEQEKAHKQAMKDLDDAKMNAKAQARAALVLKEQG